MSNVVSNITGGFSCQGLKMDLINRAYSKMRISGLTVQPSPEDLELALMTQEAMMAELECARNICLGYNQEQEPDPNSVSNLPPWAMEGLSGLLAIRLLSDFGKDPKPSLISSTNASMSAISGKAARDRLRQVQYPNRMPIGSGNYRYPRWARFYRPADLPPPDCSTKRIKVGETDNYRISFCSWLKSSESIIDFLVEPSAGLQVDNEALIGGDIEYTVTAVSQASEGIWQTVKFTITTDEGRVHIETVNFEVCKPQEVA